jgi:hypothetical protein
MDMYNLSEVHKDQLKSMETKTLQTIQILFTRMSAHPLQVTDEPLRNKSIADYATSILNERGL